MSENRTYEQLVEEELTRLAPSTQRPSPSALPGSIRLGRSVDCSPALPLDTLAAKGRAPALLGPEDDTVYVVRRTLVNGRLRRVTTAYAGQAATRLLWASHELDHVDEIETEPQADGIGLLRARAHKRRCEAIEQERQERMARPPFNWASESTDLAEPRSVARAEGGGA